MYRRVAEEPRGGQRRQRDRQHIQGHGTEAGNPHIRECPSMNEWTRTRFRLHAHQPQHPALAHTSHAPAPRPGLRSADHPNTEREIPDVFVEKPTSGGMRGGCIEPAADRSSTGAVTAPRGRSQPQRAPTSPSHVPAHDHEVIDHSTPSRRSWTSRRRIDYRGAERGHLVNETTGAPSIHGTLNFEAPRLGLRLRERTDPGHHRSTEP